MHTISTAFYALKKDLQSVYDAQEAVAIAHALMEHVTGLTRLRRLDKKDMPLNGAQEEAYSQARQRLLAGEPLQYVTGIQWFSGKPFSVNRNVLIPRPETEELVDWIAADWQAHKPFTVLDIGTGSGCIAVSLKTRLPQAAVTACDISPEALTLAKENAGRFHLDIDFRLLDFLDPGSRDMLGTYDVIVSNPPYIPLTEKDALSANVRDYEPAVALFVPAGDPLLFYRHIAGFAGTHLERQGAVYCELHRDHAADTRTLFEGLNSGAVQLRKDIHGNDRMLKLG